MQSILLKLLKALWPNVKVDKEYNRPNDNYAIDKYYHIDNVSIGLVFIFALFKNEVEIKYRT
ncbi:MAG: hypothetical protein ACI9LM_000891 [Alteromonadaceae bacterium]|jgi:hypothetical protein